MKRALVLALLPGMLAARAAGAVEPEVAALEFDLIPAELSGELGAKTYDLSVSGKDGAFLGNQQVQGGTFVGGGIGPRLTVAFEHGMQVSLEWSYEAGRINGATMPWSSHSTAGHFTGLTGIGWGFQAGPFRFHTATMLGVDNMSFDVAGPLSSVGAATPGMDPAAAAASSMGYTLSRWDLRLGQQVGVHVAFNDTVGMFADGTIDYDGQWRVHAGITFGRLRPKPRCASCALAR